MNQLKQRIPGGLALLVIALLLPIMSTAETSSESPDSSSLVLGGGCFWCIEALYETIDGVTGAVSGYAGGEMKNPTYQAICSGQTGHAEVVRIDFDPAKTSLEELLEFFWEAHDPTTLNRQGADVGPQYRSIILFDSPEQEAAAKASLEKAKAKFSAPIVTEIKPLDIFYKAEISHQDYFRNNPNAPYCRYVIAPKMKKLES
jgi:peptide-methionine (S)-S-oxide reductase